jgi:hypothetical protein
MGKQVRMLDVFSTIDAQNYEKASRFLHTLVNSFKSIKNKIFLYNILRNMIHEKYEKKSMKKHIADLMFNSDIIRNAIISIIRNKDTEEAIAACKLLIRIFTNTTQTA